MGADREFATKTNKKIRFSFNFMRSFDAVGGHSETKGLTPDGQVIQIATHRHNVNMSFNHFNFGFRYQLNSRIALSLIVPYTIKKQIADIEWTIQNPTSDDQNAAIRNGYIHHRNETYHGFDDLSFVIGYQLNGLLTSKDRAILSGGLFLPTGQTEPNPYELGGAGKKHLHLQFGTGTLTPSFQYRYWLPISESVSMQSRLVIRRPFYRNKYQFLAPPETSFFWGGTFQPMKILRLQVAWMVLRQGFGYWAEKKDQNTGLQMHAAQLSINIGRTMLLNTSVTLPLYQKMLSTGDTFEHGILLSSSISHPF